MNIYKSLLITIFLSIIFSQCQSGNCENGYGIRKYTDEGAGIYEGEFKNWLRDGYGEYEWTDGHTYVGGWKSGVFHKWGKYTFEDDEYFEGEWYEGDRKGWGKYVYENGEYYEGEWNNDLQDGLGEFHWLNGDYFEGTSKDGKYNGYGMEIYVNGDYYGGLWRDDKLITEVNYEKVVEILRNEYPQYYSSDYIEFLDTCMDGNMILRSYCDCAADQFFEMEKWDEEYYDILLNEHCMKFINAPNINEDEDGDLEVDYCKSGNCDNGYGEYIFNNNDKYIGYWYNSLMHGQGMYTWNPDGDWGGDTFTGTFVNDKYTNGAYGFSNGNIYQGTFNKDYKYEGYGKFIWNDGETWEGQWIDGEFQDNNYFDNEWIDNNSNNYDINEENYNNADFGEYYALIFAANDYKYDIAFVSNQMNEDRRHYRYNSRDDIYDNYDYDSKKYTSWPDLDGHPIRESLDLINILTKQYGFKTENIIYVENPTREDIIEGLEKVKSNLNESDNLLILYSGHGFYIPEDNQQGFWIPVNGKPDSRVNWVSNSEIKSIIAGMRSKNILLLTDACFSGAIFTSKSLNSINVNNFFDLHNTKSKIALTAGNIEEVPGKSIFMKEVISALRDNPNKFISSQDIFNIIYSPVFEGSNGNKPQWGVVDKGTSLGDFVFMRTENNSKFNYLNAIENLFKPFNDKNSDNNIRGNSLWNTEIGREYEKNFMGSCTEGEYGWEDYCQCALDWIKEYYPNPNTADAAVADDPKWMDYLMDVCLDLLP